MREIRRWGRRFNRVLFVMMVSSVACILAASAVDAQNIEMLTRSTEKASADAGKSKLENSKALATGSEKDGKKWRVRDDAPTGAECKQGSSKVAVIEIADEIITGGVEEYIVSSIDRAERENYGLLVLVLDTPGGLVEDTQHIVKRMLTSTVPIVVYVSPPGSRAGSAGTFITLAGHVAVMAPTTRLGAAHPIEMPIVPDMGGKEKDKEEAKKKASQDAIHMEKITNDTAMFIVSIAKERGRNVHWAENAVRKSVVATADEAVKNNIVDFISTDLTDLLDKLDGRFIRLNGKNCVHVHTSNAKIDRWGMSLKQKVWTGLGNPNLLMLLVLLGLGGIAMEFYHPGMILPGAVGALALLLAAISMKILPVSVGGLVLVLVGVGLMVAEAYVVSYGLLGLAGAGLMILGGILLIDPSTQPHYLDPAMQVDWTVLIGTAATFAVLFILVGYFVVRTQRGKIKTGSEGMKGETGEARSDFVGGKGKVFSHGEYWNAVCDEEIKKGDSVVIEEVLEGMRVRVKKS